jgi:plasmid stability protein
MATLYVRDIPDTLYQQAKKIADSQGRSLSAYVLIMLQQAVEEEKIRQNRVKALSSIRRRRRPLPSNVPDSVTMLRQIRGDER